MEFKFNIKSLGKKRPYIRNEVIALDISTSTTLRILLEKIVNHQVNLFNERKEGKNLLTYFNENKVTDQAQNGRITFKAQYNTQVADSEKAINVVWQAFEDGLIAFFINNEQIENIEQAIHLNEADSFTIVRLTFLTGGIL